MDLRDSLHNDLVAQVSDNHVRHVLATMLKKKEEDIQALRDKIIKYEQKSRAEDAFYQNLSPIRKLFTGRAPSHHRAVEYMVNVKDRMKKMESLKLQVNELSALINKVDQSAESLTLSHSILEELRPLLLTGDLHA